MTRLQSKEYSAKALNRIPADVLFDSFQITRVGEITGLDNIGVPVWSATRPCGKIVSVTAGKSLDSQMARAGAIAEAIEHSAFENPTGYYLIADWTKRDPSNMWLVKGAKWKEATKIAVEPLMHLASGKEVLFPSDLVWLGNRLKPKPFFQRTSNGQALAGTFDEAFLAGIYECVERDAITIRTCAMQEFGRIPPKHDLATLEDNLSNLHAKISQARLKLFLFHCTFDIPIPVYWAIVIDPSGELPPFPGWGCNLDSRVAAERAILEAIQSRLVYISGARDDIQRRNFDLLRNRDPSRLIQTYENLPASDTFSNKLGDLEPALEKDMVLMRLVYWRKRILYKHLKTPCGFHAMKVFVLGLENPITPMWQPSRWLTMRKYYEDHDDLFCWANVIRGGDRKTGGRVMVSTSRSG